MAIELGIEDDHEAEPSRFAADLPASAYSPRSKDLTASIGGEVPSLNMSLSPREAEALRLYASGFGQYQVARRMGISQASVKEHIDRVRAKYAHWGRPAPTKIDLFKRAIEDGLLPPVVPLSR